MAFILLFCMSVVCHLHVLCVSSVCPLYVCYKVFCISVVCPLCVRCTWHWHGLPFTSTCVVSIRETDGVFSFPSSHLRMIPTDGMAPRPSHYSVGESKQKAIITARLERRACVALSLRTRFTSSSDIPVVIRVELNNESGGAGETPDLFRKTHQEIG